MKSDNIENVVVSNKGKVKMKRLATEQEKKEELIYIIKGIVFSVLEKKNPGMVENKVLLKELTLDVINRLGVKKFGVDMFLENREGLKSSVESLLAQTFKRRIISANRSMPETQKIFFPDSVTPEPSDDRRGL